MMQIQKLVAISSSVANTTGAKWGYFSLIFSLFYFISLVANFGQYTTAQVILACVNYALFIGLYILAIYQKGYTVAYPIIGIIVLSTATAYFHPGANALFGYAAFLAGYYFRISAALLLLGLNLAGQVISVYWFDLYSPFYLATSAVVTLGLMVFGVFSQKEHLHQAEQDKKNEQIEQLSTIAERERIARDMHDLLGHSLSSLALKSELAKKLIEKSQYSEAHKEIAEVAELARQSLSEVRHAVSGLKQQGLQAHLTQLTTRLNQLGFKTQLTLDITELSAKLESSLIMLCREWITNILRHSNGNQVLIELIQTEDKVKLTITDNGTVKQIIAGNGIEGMKTRAEQLNGELNIQFKQGVQLLVNLPHTHK
ncbi:sensor histidine kinase [Catenovulum sp. 2E275]|uniref:sensor histidine kinase n=1 Tax=Catenovulum sp. 2E275 TaxID=2980497 RepID=UPI0021D1F101|nr:sensor histidine kinase [Catenovulum sp. 2E275]MCU4675140.1 sensor histidine kinase [Catenovulum sp. 2E275]